MGKAQNPKRTAPKELTKPKSNPGMASQPADSRQHDLSNRHQVAINTVMPFQNPEVAGPFAITSNLP
jgi:hypothetical protein